MKNTIESTVTGIPDYVDKIVVVDDCSRDDTVNRVNALLQHQPGRIFLVAHAENQGVGGAIASGYIWCRDHDIDIAVVMAGDAQMDPDDLPALLEPLLNGEYDYAKGNRLFSGDAWNLIPRARYLGNAAMSLLTKIASGYWHVAIFNVDLPPSIERRCEPSIGRKCISATVNQTICWSA